MEADLNMADHFERHLSDTNALITGASRGIGKALAEKLLESNARVSGVARHFEQQIGVERNLVGYEFDLSDVDSLPQEMERLPKDINVLVLNAGYGKFGGLEQFSYADIRKLVDTNLIANIMLAKHYLSRMKTQGEGDIVIVGSESSLNGARAGAVYCATKFAMRGFAQSLRADCSTSNIRTLLVNPGPVDSNFFDELDFEPRGETDFSLNPDDVAQAIIHALMQPRHVVTEEINMQPMKRSFIKK